MEYTIHILLRFCVVHEYASKLKVIVSAQPYALELVGGQRKAKPFSFEPF